MRGPHFPDFHFPKRACFVSTLFASPSDFHMSHTFLLAHLRLAHLRADHTLSLFLIHFATTQTFPPYRPHFPPAHNLEIVQHVPQGSHPLNLVMSTKATKTHPGCLSSTTATYTAATTPHSRTHIPHSPTIHARCFHPAATLVTQREQNRRVLGRSQQHNRVQDSRLLGGPAACMAPLQGHLRGYERWIRREPLLPAAERRVA